MRMWGVGRWVESSGCCVEGVRCWVEGLGWSVLGLTGHGVLERKERLVVHPHAPCFRLW